MIAVNEALEKLAAADEQAAELVKLHYFAGLTIDETARVLGLSVRKAYTVWAYSRAWLFRCLEGNALPGLDLTDFLFSSCSLRPATSHCG